jgi:hypothetical protein
LQTGLLGFWQRYGEHSSVEVRLYLTLLDFYPKGDSSLKRAISPLGVAGATDLRLTLLLLFLFTFKNEVAWLEGDLDIALLHARKLCLDSDLSLILRHGDLGLKLALTNGRDSDRLPHVLKRGVNRSAHLTNNRGEITAKELLWNKWVLTAWHRNLHRYIV